MGASSSPALIEARLPSVAVLIDMRVPSSLLIEISSRDFDKMDLILRFVFNNNAGR
jgi:hypothetical protein